MSDLPILFSGPMVRAILREVDQPGTGKTQTRRVIDAPGLDGWHVDRVGSTGWQWTAEGGAPHIPFRPRYAAGDRLYVREAIGRRPASFLGIEATNGVENAFYVADDAEVLNEHGFNICPWWERRRAIPAMHMPRWASRITLIVTDVRVQRLQEISEADAIAEGVIRQDPTPEDEEWNCRWCEEIGIEPDPMDPVWLAPGTRQGFDSRPDDPKWGPTPEFAFRLLWDSINGDRPGCAWQDNPWVAAYSFRPILGNVDQVRA